MKQRKTDFRPIIIASLSAIVLLTGCQNQSSAPIEQTTTSQHSTTASDPHVAEIEYYKKTIAELESSILMLNEEKYISDCENKLTIEELKNEISALKNKIEKAEQETSTPLETVKTDDLSHEVKQEFEYSLSDGNATITAYRGKSQIIYVPSSIDGYPVVSIGESAFAGSDATDIYLPVGVTNIGWFAFSGCYSLSHISIPFTVSSVEYGAFEGCPASMTIKCDKGSYIEAYAASWGLLYTNN